MKYIIFIFIVAVIIVVLAAIGMKVGNIQKQPIAAYRKKYLLTKNEYSFYQKIKPIIQEKNLRVLCKIRLADLIEPEYDNLKSECAFKLAELINNRQIRVICTEVQRERIMEELAVLKQDHIDADTRKKGIINKEKMKEILGHSPDYLDMLIMAMLFRIKPIPKRPKAKLGQI